MNRHTEITNKIIPIRQIVKVKLYNDTLSVGLDVPVDKYARMPNIERLDLVYRTLESQYDIKISMDNEISFNGEILIVRS